MRAFAHNGEVSMGTVAAFKEESGAGFGSNEEGNSGDGIGSQETGEGFRI